MLDLWSQVDALDAGSTAEGTDGVDMGIQPAPFSSQSFQHRLSGKRGLCPSGLRKGCTEHFYTFKHIWTREKRLAWLDVHDFTQSTRGLEHCFMSCLEKPSVLQYQARLTAYLQLLPHVPREHGPLSCKSARPQPNRWTLG